MKGIGSGMYGFNSYMSLNDRTSIMGDLGEHVVRNPGVTLNMGISSRTACEITKSSVESAGLLVGAFGSNNTTKLVGMGVGAAASRVDCSKHSDSDTCNLI